MGAAGRDDDLAAHAHPNTNPELEEMTIDGTPVAEGAPPLPVKTGQSVHVRASWRACAPSDVTCPGAESYAVFDVDSHEVSPRREGMRVSWFASAGDYAAEHTGRDGADEANFSENDWTAPDAPTTAHLWIVVRDDRGGAGWRSFAVDVR